MLIVGAGDVGRWFGATVDADVAFADADPEAAERAASALDAARDVARERVPDELDTIERLRDRLSERRAAKADEPGADEAGADTSGDLTARETVVVTPEDGEESDADDSGAAVDDDGAPTDGDETPIDGDTPADGDENALTDGDEDAPTDGDREIANALAEAMADETQDSIAGTVDETMGNVGAGEPDADVREGNSDGDDWVFVDDGTDDEWAAAERAEAAAVESEESGAEAGESIADSGGSDAEAGEADVVDSETRIERSGVETSEPAEAERSARGLSSLAAADLRATTPAPVTVTVAVLAVDAASAAAVDPDDVDRFAAAVERADDLDEAALAVGARLPEQTRERAADRDVRVLEPDALADAIDGHDVSIPEDGAAEF